MQWLSDDGVAFTTAEITPAGFADRFLISGPRELICPIPETVYEAPVGLSHVHVDGSNQ